MMRQTKKIRISVRSIGLRPFGDKINPAFALRGYGGHGKMDKIIWEKNKENSVYSVHSVKKISNMLVRM